MFTDEYDIETDNTCSGLRHPIGATVRLVTGQTGIIIGKWHRGTAPPGFCSLPCDPFYVVRLRRGRKNYKVTEDQVVERVVKS